MITKPADLANPAMASEELNRILASRDFKASERIRRLLKHLVQCRIDGYIDKLTQRQLAEDIFDRANDFDPDRDAIVRVEMRKLRQALEGFYAVHAETGNIIIRIPVGSYVPDIEYVATKTDNKPDQIRTPLSLAVLNFRDLSEDRRGEWIAEGIHDELLTILGRIPEIKLLPHYGTHARDENIDLSSLHDEHGVRFVLDGSIRLTGNAVRVHVRLHDLEADRQVWSQRYDRPVKPDSLVELEEDIARQVIAEAADPLTGLIGRSLRDELLKSNFVRDDVYAAKIYFHRYLHQTSDDAYRDASNATEAAILKNPDDPLLLSMHADLLRAGYAMGFIDIADPGDQVLQMGERALALSPECIPCRISFCFTLLYRRDLERLSNEINRILSDHTIPWSYRSDAAVPYALSGHWDEGCAILNESLVNNSVTPHYFQYPLFFQDFLAGEYALAAERARHFADTGSLWRPMLNASILGKLGDIAAARRHIEELLRIRPSPRNIIRRSLASYLAQDSLIDEIVDGLQAAGLDL